MYIEGGCFKRKMMEEMEELTDLAVRGLEELIDFQNYPVNAAEVSTKNTMSDFLLSKALTEFLRFKSSSLETFSQS